MAFFLFGWLWLYLALKVFERAEDRHREAIKESRAAKLKYESGVQGLLDYAEALGVGITQEDLERVWNDEA